MGWTDYALAFWAFFVRHTLPIRPPMRPRLVARLGQWGFGAAYSGLSIAALAWLIGAADRAPFGPLWSSSPWQLLVPLFAMLPVCLIVALAIGRPNPFSFGGARNETFDPARPGIVRFTRHPLLLALAIWAFAHVMPNGDLAHVILFGTFGAFALLGGRLVDRRKRREMGEYWVDLHVALRAASPFSPPMSWPGLVLRIALGTGLYLALVWLHPWLFGVSPFP